MVRLVTYIRLSTHVSSTKLKKGHIHVSHAIFRSENCDMHIPRHHTKYELVPPSVKR